MQSKHTRKHPESQNGFSIIELLVVLAVIAVLIGLLLPAIQSARAAARLVDCSSRMRQIGLAFHNFENSKRYLPGNGGYNGKAELQSVDGDWIVPTTIDFSLGKTFRWGFGTPDASLKEQGGPWSYSILAYFELGNLFDSSHFVPQLNAFVCPARNRQNATTTETDRFGRYLSGGHAMAKTDYAANHLAIQDLGSTLKLRDVTDGLSQTILAGEKAWNAEVQTSSSWYWDEPIWIGGSKGTARSGTHLIPDSNAVNFKNAWGSAHKSVVVFVFFDGHVTKRAISNDSDALLSELTPVESVNH